MRRLGRSDIEIAPIVMGGNAFGWTMDEATSFDVLDGFVDAGFNAIDTADVYSRWVPGNDSESEKIIGRWMKSRNNRDRVVVFTKVGMSMGEGTGGLGRDWIIRAVEGSLKRLQTDVIDLYQSHKPDPSVPVEETLEAYEKLISAGKVRAIGASAHDLEQMQSAGVASETHNLPRYETLQNEFNLCERDAFNAALQAYCADNEIAGIHYKGLASGFLTGKYRTWDDAGLSRRSARVAKDHFNDRGWSVLAALDGVAARTGASNAAVALAWVIAQPGVAATLVSATSREQLNQVLNGAELRLSAEDIALLNAA